MSFHQRSIQPWSIQTESHLTLHTSECWDVIKGGAIKEGDVEGAHQQISRRAADSAARHKGQRHRPPIVRGGAFMYTFLPPTSARHSPVLLGWILDVFIVANSLFPAVTSNTKCLNTDTAAFMQYSNETLHILKTMRRRWRTIKYQLYIKLQKSLRYDSWDEEMLLCQAQLCLHLKTDNWPQKWLTVFQSTNQITD